MPGTGLPLRGEALNTAGVVLPRRSSQSSGKEILICKAHIYRVPGRNSASALPVTPHGSGMRGHYGQCVDWSGGQEFGTRPTRRAVNTTAQLWPPHRAEAGYQAMGSEGSGLGGSYIDASLLLGPQVHTSASPIRSHQDAHPQKNAP